MKTVITHHSNGTLPTNGIPLLLQMESWQIRYIQYIEYLTLFLCSLPALIIEIMNFKVAVRRKEKAKPPKVVIIHMATWVGNLSAIVVYAFYVVIIWRPYPVRIHSNGWIMYFLGTGVYDGIAISGMCIALMILDRTILLVNPNYLDVTRLPKIFYRIWVAFVVVVLLGTGIFEFPLEWDSCKLGPEEILRFYVPASLTFYEFVPEYHMWALMAGRVLIGIVNLCLFLRLVAAVRSHYSHFENRDELAERVLIVATIFQGIHGVLPQMVRLFFQYFLPKYLYFVHIYNALGLSLESVVTVHAHWKVLKDMKNSVIPQSAKPPQRGSTHFSTPYD
ncbi:unnamed protein product [Bursaphelenchus xylophilus]|uniref:(pine wood nematode) hypothetical protein n=1 Tax=Bursaphelenchus xylophilus TaxID=6326 RepID=A0A1I7RWV0_BURXY|nr:unnamed protein product [Bursaphelenchus xylophilus]CAG9128723.1 unnamed protein product [Bursaphelenchus xylophilus]